MKLRLWFLLCLCCGYAHAAIASHHAIQANTLYPFETRAKEVQFQHLLKELRCLVCQNQDLADSHASLADDLRREVYLLVQKGNSDDTIRSYLTTRYGDFILFKPPVIGVTWLLWFGPWVFLALGLGIFWHMGLKRTSHE